MKPQPLVLHRNEAVQMALDLGTTIERLIALGAEMSDTDKICLFDQLVTLQTKKNILEGEVTYSDARAAERDLEVAAQRREVQP